MGKSLTSDFNQAIENLGAKGKGDEWEVWHNVVKAVGGVWFSFLSAFFIDKSVANLLKWISEKDSEFQDFH